MSLVGSSTETDFSTKVCGVFVVAGADAAAGGGRSFGPGWPMIASTTPASTAAPNPTWAALIICASRCRQVDCFDGVVHEAARVPVHRPGLGEAIAVGAADHDRQGTGRRRDLGLPLAEAVLALV